MADNKSKIDQERVEAARKILDGGSAKVYKSTRSGFTTSAVIAAKESQKRILCVSPTIRILKETVKKASVESAILVPANCFCSILNEEIKKDKFLKKLPIILPQCEKCMGFGICDVTEILNAKEPQVIGITYRKLEALMLSKSDIAKQIKKKLSEIDIVMLDEAHTIALPDVVRVKAFTEVVIPDEFTTLIKIHQKWIDFNVEQIRVIDHMKHMGDEQHIGKHLSKLVSVDHPLTFEWISAAFDELLRLAKRRIKLEVAEEDIIALRDIISLISGYFVAVAYIKENDRSEGDVCLTGNYWIYHRALSEFLANYVPSVPHLYVSGTLIEPHDNFYSDLSGHEVQDAMFPDLRKTNSKMSIYPDSWRISSHNFNQQLGRIVSRITQISQDSQGEWVYVVAPSLMKARLLEEKLKEINGVNAIVDYYRSDQTMGVELKFRICIAVGLAEYRRIRTTIKQWERTRRRGGYIHSV